MSLLANACPQIVFDPWGHAQSNNRWVSTDKMFETSTGNVLCRFLKTVVVFFVLAKKCPTQPRSRRKTEKNLSSSGTRIHTTKGTCDPAVCFLEDLLWTSATPHSREKTCSKGRRLDLVEDRNNFWNSVRCPSQIVVKIEAHRPSVCFQGRATASIQFMVDMPPIPKKS